jgi:peptidoglycan/LPS O-acetylase OafA/YrhL
MLTSAEARFLETRDRILARRNPEQLAREKAEFEAMTDEELVAIAWPAMLSDGRKNPPLDRRERRQHTYMGLAIALIAVSAALGFVLLLNDHIFRATPFFFAVVLAIHYGARLKCEREAAWLSALGSFPIVVLFGLTKHADTTWYIGNSAFLAAIATLAHFKYPAARPVHSAWLARPPRRRNLI